jgi:Nuclease-related domain
VVERTDGSDLAIGRRGASARAEFERRRRGDAARREVRFGRVLGPVVGWLAGVRPSTARWRIGGRAEERVGAYLTATVGRRGIVLHDRIVPGGRGNIDHLAVVASGIWVVDTKCYRGRVRRARPRGRWSLRRTLVVNGHERSQLLAGSLRQRALVLVAVGPGVPVRAVLCFAGAERGAVTRTFKVGGVTVARPAALARALRAAGPLDHERRQALAAALARAFPPYPVEGDTRHRGHSIPAAERGASARWAGAPLLGRVVARREVP